jgi:PIN domain nuclease of toxin-antitoxin system
VIFVTYVADTHALVWYLSGSRPIGKAARVAFDAATGGDGMVVIPAIVIAEMVMLAEKRRATIDVANVVAKLKEQAGFDFMPLLPDTVLRTRSLAVLPDIHDRLIVAEALELEASLITVDHAITASGLVPVIW